MKHDPPQKPGPPPGRKGTLAAVIGSAAGATMLFFMVPQNESGGRRYLDAYRDIAGVWTGCDGIIRKPDGTPVRKGDRFTPAQCDTMLERELIAHAIPIVQCVPGLKGRTNQAVAAVDLSYNIGPVGVCRSSIARAWNAGRWREGCDRILVFNKARVNGILRPVKGLTARRQRERTLCLTGLS